MARTDADNRLDVSAVTDWPPHAARLVRIALLGLVATVPFAIHTIYQRISFSQAYYVKLAGLSVAMLALATMVVLRLPLRRPTWLFWAYLAYIAVAVVSVAVRPVVGYGLSQAVFPITGAAVLFALETVPWDRRRRESAFLLLAAVGFICAAYGIAQNFGFELIKRMPLETERQVLSSFFGHSNFMASFLGPIIFLAAYFLAGRFDRRLRAFAAVAVAASLLCFYWAGTRAATLAVVVAALSLVVGRREPLASQRARPLLSRKLLAAVLVASVAAATLWGQYGGRHRETLLRRLSSHREISNRFFYWLVGAEMIRDHPLLGIGYGRFNTEFWPYCERTVARPGSKPLRFILREMKGLNPGEVHNDFIEIACESGLLGMLAFLAVWVFAFGFCWEAARRGDEDDRRMARYLRAALVFILVDSQFGFPLQLPASGLLFWLLLGFVAQTYRRAALERPVASAVAADRTGAAGAPTLA